jgi:hypothetical protein
MHSDTLYLMREDGQYERNMQYVLNGLMKFVVVDGKQLSTFKTKLVNVRIPL